MGITLRRVSRELLGLDPGAPKSHCGPFLELRLEAFGLADGSGWAGFQVPSNTGGCRAFCHPLQSKEIRPFRMIRPSAWRVASSTI